MLLIGKVKLVFCFVLLFEREVYIRRNTILDEKGRDHENSRSAKCSTFYSLGMGVRGRVMGVVSSPAKLRGGGDMCFPALFVAT